VPAGTPESSHVGKWTYTNRTAAGTYETGPLTAGDYEARFYGNGAYSDLIERVRFTVP
jgi:hypothetical protein